MIKINFVLAIAFMGFISCKDRKQAEGKEATAQKTLEIVQDSAKDSAEIRTVITDFYTWYNKNYSKFDNYHLYSGIKKKDTPPYKMNWDEVEKYQQFIRDSVPQLGEEFIKNQKHFFQQCDSAFKVDVEDEIPYGFDYDWYTNSQEDPQYLVDEINKSLPWDSKRAGDHARVDIKTAYDDNGKKTTETAITIIMKKENGKWKIAKTWSE
jgi:hypothetical protein